MDALTILFYGNKTFLAALEGLKHDHWLTGGVCGVWSVKDIVAHMACYELLIGDVLGTFTGAAEHPMLDRKAAMGEAWNDATVAERRHLTAQAALDEYLAAYAQKMARAEAVGAAKLAEVGTIPWYGEKYALDDYLVYTDYGHKREHAAQIMVFRDTLK
ncbi:MAG: maleylpyruvate isomerase N-terminal domain-containing protein [Chloroflexi bacterium]|jgi:uncharacterized damage-inducible protein DinB|nr:MAG: hypothetical protein UZ13_03773 [Chloroflexi bacterium OLB13]MBC6955605.1 DUF664 domain-containing protein [Chloroflexota bacterium]MBV6437215.1 hypothetical protein [Anaerolineae bacterium]MDL1914911.1 DUF664 domain-containing protein [Anaerolineae bacterium CFX4]OQY84972.1 MAG: hypothetical protein B6D42_04345 [Anaerolineae bacterium UTCFX5]